MAQPALGISHSVPSGTWKYYPFFLKGSLELSILLSSGVVTALGNRILHERQLVLSPGSNWVSVKDRVTALRQHLPLHAVPIFGALESFSRAWMSRVPGNAGNRAQRQSALT